MIKINLLPPYIHQRKRTRLAMVLVAVLLAAEVGAVVFYKTSQLDPERERLTARLDDVSRQVTALQALGTESGQVLAEEATFRPKFSFVDGMRTYNQHLPGIYGRTARYTYANAMLFNMVAQQTQLTMSAYISQADDIARLMLGLSRSPDISGLPQITGNPGYDPAQEAARAAQDRQTAASTIIGGQVVGGGEAGPGGMYAAMMGGGAGGGAMMGGPPGGSIPYGGMMGGGMMGGGAGGGAMMGGPPGGSIPYGGGGLGGSGGGDLNLLPIQGARLRPRGFTVNIQCVLNKTASRPSYGSSENQASSGGGGGGGGGGMYAAMMGGAMGGAGMSGGPPGGASMMGVTVAR